MEGLLWIAQILLACIFLLMGLSKLIPGLAGRLPFGRAEMSRSQAVVVGVLEVVGALAVIVPGALLPPALAEDYLFVRAAAAFLALVMVVAGIYHLARREPAAPAVSLFLLAVFIIVGRWPH